MHEMRREERKRGLFLVVVSPPKVSGLMAQMLEYQMYTYLHIGSARALMQHHDLGDSGYAQCKHHFSCKGQVFLACSWQ